MLDTSSFLHGIASGARRLRYGRSSTPLKVRFTYSPYELCVAAARPVAEQVNDLIQSCFKSCERTRFDVREPTRPPPYGISRVIGSLCQSLDQVFVAGQPMHLQVLPDFVNRPGPASNLDATKRDGTFGRGVRFPIVAIRFPANRPSLGEPGGCDGEVT
jgi:hypothetical protein